MSLADDEFNTVETVSRKSKAILAPTIILNNGYEMPILGLGTYFMVDKVAENAVKSAIDGGYRHIDTATVYGNEIDIGKAIKAKIDEGVISRDDMFICTKLLGTHHRPQMVELSCQNSLANLGLTYIDLFIIHFPIAFDEVVTKRKDTIVVPADTDYIQTWSAMELLVEKGLVKSIGVSNFNSEQVDRILQDCKIKPAVNQIECHPNFNQKEFISFLQKRNIVVVAYSPLTRPKPFNELPDFLSNDTALELRNKYRKTNIQIALRYLIQLGVVPIPKSKNRRHLYENIDIFDFELTADDMAIMDQYNNNERLLPFKSFHTHRFYPFKIPY